VRQIDQAHHAKDQRQAGGHQKQHDAELKSVEQLFDDQGEVGKRVFPKLVVSSSAEETKCDCSKMRRIMQ
jgi:hypothetical protein